jgi:hypothetical protein
MIFRAPVALTCVPFHAAHFRKMDDKQFMGTFCGTSHRRFQNQQAFTDQILKALTGTTCFLLTPK